MPPKEEGNKVAPETMSSLGTPSVAVKASHVVAPLKEVTHRAGEVVKVLKDKVLEARMRKKHASYCNADGVHEPSMLKWLNYKSDEDMIEEKWGDHSWRLRVMRFLHNHKVQSFLAFLLACDVLIVYTEVFVDAHWPACHQITRDAISCCADTAANAALHTVAAVAAGHAAPAHAAPADAHHRLLSGGGGGGHHDVCPHGLLANPQKQAGCDEHKYPNVHTAHTALTSVSVAILLVFELELLGMLFTLRKIFLKNVLYMVDLLIVTTSLCLDIHVLTGDGSDAQLMARILIFIRIWRLMRITHGVAATVHEKNMHVIEEIADHAKELEEQLSELQEKLKQAEAGQLSDQEINV